MSCVFYNLSVDQGETFILSLQLKDENLNPINLSGYSARAKVRESFSATGVLLDLTPTIYSYESGLINLTIAANQTSGLFVGQWPYDLEVYNSGETDVIKGMKGYMNVWPEVCY